MSRRKGLRESESHSSRTARLRGEAQQRNFLPSVSGKNLSMFIQLDTVASGQTNCLQKSSLHKKKKYVDLLKRMTRGKCPRNNKKGC